MQVDPTTGLVLDASGNVVLDANGHAVEGGMDRPAGVSTRITGNPSQDQGPTIFGIPRWMVIAGVIALAWYYMKGRK